MQCEFPASLFGTGFSLWNAREVRLGVNPHFPVHTDIFFGTARATIKWKYRGRTVSEEKSTSNLHLIEKRAERRILVHVPVEVTEIDSKGRHITERTFIEDVSDFGCRFSTRGPVQQGDTVAMRILGPNGKQLLDEESRLYEIMWVARKEHGSTVGARVLQGEKLANVKFPLEIGGQKRDPK
jgi:hypothetical protein